MRDQNDAILTRSALAEMVGTTSASVRNYETRASRCASLAVRHAFASALNMSVNVLFDKEGRAK